MTTDGTSSTPESPRPSPAAFNPEDDYPDSRDDGQRADDQQNAAAQSAALTDSGDEPARVPSNDMIERIREDRLDMAGLELPRSSDPVRRIARPRIRGTPISRTWAS